MHHRAIEKVANPRKLGVIESVGTRAVKMSCIVYAFSPKITHKRKCHSIQEKWQRTSELLLRKRGGVESAIYENAKLSRASGGSIDRVVYNKYTKKFKFVMQVKAAKPCETKCLQEQLRNS